MTTHTQDARQLLEQVRLLSASRQTELLALVTKNEPSMTARFPAPEDAESCRLAAIAASELNQYPFGVLWRSRALVRFAALNWHSGVAAILMADIFRLLEMANGTGYERLTIDQLQPAPMAIDLLETLRPLAEGPPSGYGFGPTPELIARFISEKSGLLYLLAHDYEAARRCYAEAQTHVAGEPRGELKVPLGAALVEYYADRAAGNDGRYAVQLTEQLLAGHSIDEFDFLKAGPVNLERMAVGRMDLYSYEAL